MRDLTLEEVRSMNLGALRDMRDKLKRIERANNRMRSAARAQAAAMQRQLVELEIRRREDSEAARPPTPTWPVAVITAEGRRREVRVDIRDLRNVYPLIGERCTCAAVLPVVFDGRLRARLYCDEDGERRHLPANPWASVVYGREIVGDVVLVTEENYLNANQPAEPEKE